MKIPISKLKAILLFFGHNTDTKFLGKVKLMKLFYFLDFVHVKKYGLPVTYDTYFNLEHGPIPSAIKNLVDTASDDVDNSLLSDVISFERPEGTNMYRVLPRREFTEGDAKLFSNSEMDTMQEISARFKDFNTKKIEEASHQEAPWRETKLLQEIPYTLAAKDQDCQVTEEEIALAMRVL